MDVTGLRQSISHDPYTPLPPPHACLISLYTALVSSICRPAVDMSAVCECVCLASGVYPSSTRLLGVIARQARPGRAPLSLLLLLLLPLTCRRSNKMFVDVVDAWLWIYDTLVIAVVSFR